jgi:hypothetical protein
MDNIAPITNWALFLLPRAALIFLVLTVLVWLSSQTLKWFISDSGDPVPEFEVVGQASADTKTLLPRLLNAEFTRIKADLTSGAAAVELQLKAWEQEFEVARQRRELAQQNAKAASVLANAAPGNEQVAASEVRGGVDLSRVEEATKNLQLLSTTLTPTNVPDIKIASVELGPVLRWLVELFRRPNANKVVVFDSNFALIEGPIINEKSTILQLDPVEQGAQRTAQQTAEAIAYHILSSKLSSSEFKVDFGGWIAMRDFIVGAKGLARLVSKSQPGPTEMATWREDVVKAAKRIENAGVAAREWQFLTLASFLFERADDFDNAIRVLDRYPELAPQAVRGSREARLDYLRERRVESAVSDALKTQQSGGEVFSAAARALGQMPKMRAIQKLHRLGVPPGTPSVKVALIGGAKPPWFGMDRPAEAIPLEGALDQHGAQLAQIVRALTPSADVTFFPVAANEYGGVQTSELLMALENAAGSNAPIILLPFGPLKETATWGQVFDRILTSGQLVIVPAGHSGSATPENLPDELVSKILVAESIDANGVYSKFSSQVSGALAAVGSVLPSVTITDAGPTVVVGDGTGLAAATLTAVAVETLAREPSLRGATLRDALVAASRSLGQNGPKIARVAIPR